ncbi:hypothetical protein MPSEU_000695500 [Mayamaea pseudoterrestris]|nr:hypothetical protein MPSEU_000695500 [Mayamaea pseudoterrestris]
MPYSDNPNQSFVGPPTGPPLRGRPTGPPTRGRPTGPPRYPGQALPPPSTAVVPPPSQQLDTYENEPGAGTSSYETPRQAKYSTANLRQSGNWRKYGCICLMFLLFVAFGIGLSILIDKVFFKEEESTEQPFAPVDNSTFPGSKQAVDGTCSSNAFKEDGGQGCQLLCEPTFHDCCDPFSESRLYTNGSIFPNGTNCTLDRELRGCVSYSKCQASENIYDPAPSGLADYCSMERLAQDPTSCQTICQVASCCNSYPRNCLEDKFDMCLDYASCQNLREGTPLPAAPSNLDELCFNNDKECEIICDKAECCNIGPDVTGKSCLQENFISCLSYAACSYTNETKTDIVLPPQFSVLPKPPNDIINACDDSRASEGQYTTSCTDLCTTMECCMSEDENEYCFDKDPLGCMAWYQQCQSQMTFGQ